MAMSFDELVNNMVNVSLGAAAMAADKGKELIDDLNARGAQARSDASQGDFARSMADVFKQAGGAVSDVTERLSEQGATVAERILDELIVARVRPMTKAERRRCRERARGVGCSRGSCRRASAGRCRGRCRRENRGITKAIIRHGLRHEEQPIAASRALDSGRASARRGA